ncbi:TetR/AcrR family transcriptional regulator [Actinomadura alba]|uniref:TetR/AcrR family transcriptional regulator n=1 Tax=Actinomadura alba TaxID=406431 RepID=A0ABR7LYK2_9ACTN|nr:TetR/AcrR family transcriptional regulator [Actinomadura alba]
MWARPTGDRRRSALTQEAVVAAAITLADREGLAAVSIRRVAAELGARTMSLYSYIESKEDLLDLMFDEANREVLIEDGLPGDWRAAIILIAQRTRAVLLRHPWMVEVAGRRPQVGPNGLRHVEQSLAALDPLRLDPPAGALICAAVDDYLLGHVIREVMTGGGADRGAAEAARSSTLPYLQRMARSGEFPRLAPLLDAGMPQVGETFDQGLEWLLDGIARSHGLPAGLPDGDD